MPDAAGAIMGKSIHNHKAIGSNMLNVLWKEESLRPDVLGRIMEIPISNREKEFNLAHLTMGTLISSHVGIGNILSNVLKNNRSEVQNGQMMATDRDDADEIKHS